MKQKDLIAYLEEKFEPDNMVMIKENTTEIVIPAPFRHNPERFINNLPIDCITNFRPLKPEDLTKELIKL